MNNIKGEGFIPHWRKSALFVIGFDSLIFNLQYDIGVRSAIHIHWLKVSSFDYMDSQDTSMHDTVLIQLLGTLLPNS